MASHALIGMGKRPLAKTLPLVMLCRARRSSWTGERGRGVAAVLATVLLLGVTSPAQSTRQPRPVVVARLGLVTMNPVTGDTVSRLTRGDQREPLWSPNGKKIAFATGYGNDLEISVINVDGSNRHRVTENDKLDQWPSWAPGSKRLAVERWESESFSDDEEIFVIQTNGSGERKLTRNDVDDDCPDWSPDGRRIAFDRDDESDELYTIRPDGTRLRRLTSGPARDRAPVWSPDGRKILFSRVDSMTEQTDLFVVDRNGSNLRQLTDTSLSEDSYGWSPDGTKILYLTGDGGFDPALWVMNTDGSSPTMLVDDGITFSPGASWSPNSRRIIYVRHRDDPEPSESGTTDLWSIRADGSDHHRLASTFGNEHEPNWYAGMQECLGPY